MDVMKFLRSLLSLHWLPAVRPCRSYPDYYEQKIFFGFMKSVPTFGRLWGVDVVGIIYL